MITLEIQDTRPLDVLFVCIHNAGRSQMAEAFFNRLAGNRYDAASAGTEPASALNPAVIQVMDEAGIDISGRAPKQLTPEMIEASKRIITMGCGASASCPALFTPSEDWNLPDPKNMPVARVIKLRDDIEDRVIKLIRELDKKFNKTLTQC